LIAARDAASSTTQELNFLTGRQS